MTDQNETVFEEINWEERINEKIKLLYVPELVEMDNYIDFISYKRIASINDKEKRVEEILKLRKTDVSNLKHGILLLERNRIGHIDTPVVIQFLTRTLKINMEDADLVLKRLDALNFLRIAYNENIMVK